MWYCSGRCFPRTIVGFSLLLLPALALEAQINIEEARCLSDPTGNGESLDDLDPSIATNGTGVWVAVWQADDKNHADPNILTIRSNDHGETWNAPTKLNTFAVSEGSFYNVDLAPQIAYGANGTWITVWSTQHQFAGGDNENSPDIAYSRSTDDGQTWSTALAVSDYGILDLGAANESRPVLATNGHGKWVVAWTWEEFQDSEIKYAFSKDDGLTWQDAQFIDAAAIVNNPSRNGLPWISCASDGTCVAIWKTVFDIADPTEREHGLSIARSRDSGENWGGAVPLHSDAEGTWEHHRPQIVTDGAGGWMAASYPQYMDVIMPYDEGLTFWHSADNGLTWGQPMAFDPNAALGESSGSGIPLLLQWDGACNWVVAWRGNAPYEPLRPAASSLVVSRSLDNGSHWTYPIFLTSDADTLGNGTVAAMATDQNGKFMTLWTSNTLSDGTFLVDADIFANAFTLDDCRITPEEVLRRFHSANTSVGSSLEWDEFEVEFGGGAEMFNPLDLNQSGSISVSELQRQVSAHPPIHSADRNADSVISLSELLRVAQLYNAGGYVCPQDVDATEDGFAPIPATGVQPCRHAGDYSVAGGNKFSLSEMLRAIQLFSIGRIAPCPGESEDGFCSAA